MNFGANKGQPAWQDVPGEYRSMLRRIIVTQGDTEPASVEQQKMLGMCAPSLYDLRNIYQVNVEEGRHLWAMVYLLHRYFGRDGREEAEALLERRSGDVGQPAHPRRVQRADARLARVLHVHVLHRSRRQVPALVARRIRVRSAGADVPLHADRGSAPHVRRRDRRRPHRPADGGGDGRASSSRTPTRCASLGVIDLQTIQRYLNFHYSVTLDLFGGDVSSNAASYYTTGLKGRYEEDADRGRPSAQRCDLQGRDGCQAAA